jgi:hypothetical protein
MRHLPLCSLYEGRNLLVGFQRQCVLRQPCLDLRRAVLDPLLAIMLAIWGPGQRLKRKCVHILGDVVDQGFPIDLTVLCGRPGAQRAGANLRWGRPPGDGLERGDLVLGDGVLMLFQGMHDEGLLLIELDDVRTNKAYLVFDALVIFEEVRLPSLFCDIEDLRFRVVG